MSGAVGALSGPLHGGAPARVLPMLDEVAQTGDPDGYVEEHPRGARKDHGLRASRLPRRGSALPRILKRTAKELGSPRYEVAEALEEAALAALHERKPDYVIATNVEFYSAVVLDVADVPPDLTPAMFACARVAGWSGAHPGGEADGPLDPAPPPSTSGRKSRSLSELGGTPVAS